MEKLTGFEVCSRFGLNVLELAQACHEGKLVAYSPFDGRRVAPTSQCKIERKNPIQFCVLDFPFIPDEILLCEEIDRYFTVYINSKKYSFDDDKKIEFKDCKYSLIKSHEQKINIISKGYNFDGFDFKEVPFEQELGTISPKIILELKDLKRSERINISIIARKNPTISGDMENNYYKLEEYIDLKNEKGVISISQNKETRLLMLSQNFSIRQELQKKGVKNIDHITSKKLEFLWNNSFIYSTSDGVTLGDDDFFIFDYETYEALHNYYEYEDNFAKKSFSDNINSFYYIEHDVLRFIEYNKDIRLLESDPKEYIICIYKRILEESSSDIEKRNINAYIQKINGKSLSEIADSQHGKDKSQISRMISKSMQKITKKYNVPYVDWKNFDIHQKDKAKRNKEIIQDIKEQLKIIRSNV